MNTGPIARALVLLSALLIVPTCSEPQAPYFPLTEGMTWEYQITLRHRSHPGGVPQPVAGRAVATNLPKRTLEGVDVRPQRWDIGGQVGLTFFVESERGVYAYARQPIGAVKPEIESGAWYVLKYPVSLGMEWEDRGQTFFLGENARFPQTSRVASVRDVVTVPAGTFEGCVRLASTGSARLRLPSFVGEAIVTVTADAWYAPGIGLVKAVQSESTSRAVLDSGEVGFELVSYRKP